MSELVTKDFLKREPIGYEAVLLAHIDVVQTELVSLRDRFKRAEGMLGHEFTGDGPDEFVTEQFKAFLDGVRRYAEHKHGKATVVLSLQGSNIVGAVRFRNAEKSARTVEVTGEIMADYDKNGNLLCIELLGQTEEVEIPLRIEVA